MANITASMVKELREMTGAGMMECKKALAEAEGEMEKAVDVLRTRGLAAVAKKAGRATNEGTGMALVNDACTTGAEDVPADVAAHEMEIYKAQAAESGKPEAIQEKIALGRMDKFYKENCLAEQDFVKNPDLTVAQYADECAQELGGKIAITGFVRFALGE